MEKSTPQPVLVGCFTLSFAKCNITIDVCMVITEDFAGMFQTLHIPF